jgi:hypothetical protein
MSGATAYVLALRAWSKKTIVLGLTTAWALAVPRGRCERGEDRTGMAMTDSGLRWREKRAASRGRCERCLRRRIAGVCVIGCLAVPERLGFAGERRRHDAGRSRRGSNATAAIGDGEAPMLSSDVSERVEPSVNDGVVLVRRYVNCLLGGTRAQDAGGERRKRNGGGSCCETLGESEAWRLMVPSLEAS